VFPVNLEAKAVDIEAEALLCVCDA
jgi:hypothetical protein